MSWNNRTNTISPDRCIVAWDIETAPLPEPRLTPTHEKRIGKEKRILLDRRSGMGESEAEQMAQSTHSLTGWICCISAVAGSLETGHREPVSFTAASIEEERVLLERFWQKVRGFDCKPVWATFNGKNFDVPFLLARSAHYDVEQTRSDLTDTYPYSFTPHADLYGAFQPSKYTLHDLCTLLGVETPKGDFDGSQVAGAVANSRVEEVAAYCEHDVAATWRCYARLHTYLS